MKRLSALLAGAAVVLVACTGPDAQPRSMRADPQAATDGNTTSAPDVTAAAAVNETPLLAVGDIGDCTTDKDEKVAAIVRARVGKVALLGDIAYPDGTLNDYNSCFNPAWRPMFDRLMPALGNHDYYDTPTAEGYFAYFGDQQGGVTGTGWYTYDIGPYWRAIVLNSRCGAVGGCTSSSPQGKFLSAELAKAKAANRRVLAYWHAPRYSSGKHGPNMSMTPFFSMLYKAGAPLVLGAHDHSYERFRPQNAQGDYRAAGVQQFVVGTGGRYLYPFERGPHQNTAVRSARTFGVLRLVLRPNSYSWNFVRAAGSTTFSDSGTRRL